MSPQGLEPSRDEAGIRAWWRGSGSEHSGGESGRAWKVSQASCREQRGFPKQESGKHLVGENTREDVKAEEGRRLPGAG